MKDDSLSSHIDPVRTKMTGIQQIPIAYVCDFDGSKSKYFLVDENLSQVCSTDDGEPESVIFDESSTEESESERVHKIINTNEENYMQLMKQSMSNLWLQIIQLSRSQDILTYSIVVKIS